MNLKCSVSIAPLRKEPSDRAEMVSQLLFGEEFNIIETQEKWVKIVCLHDGYEGWMDRKQAESISEIPFSTQPISHSIFIQNQFFPAGCYASHQDASYKPLLLEDLARSYLFSPYLWGGKTHAGIDCSGFSQMVFRLVGKNIPRDAYQQAELGEVVSFVEEAKTGDLAFFDNAEGHIIHVGILLNTHDSPFPKIIHASGWVRLDTLDSDGIKKENGEQSHRLRIIKRIDL